MSSHKRPWRKRLSTRAREQFYEAAKGDGAHPICPRCRLAVLPWDRWHAGHELSPLLGGRTAASQVEHARCNLKFAREYEVPLIAHNARVHQRFIGAWQSRTPLPGGRDDPRKRTIDGRVVDRATGEPWRPA